ncbi:hypothetical protein Aph01nite_69170 [Acrocarpospora phusangensis]|uniref:Aminoglycoside phosphotransferase domain-containing protein n=1 Tax=Acrocarpospora phusangensis TaxID=1070424 RepID=A0A919URZ9_9ACTN|nr:hypothetical protein Aph01nite_69170 [Acrocarpospora phusangensis]
MVISGGGAILGEAGPFLVESPWWADVEAVSASLEAAVGAPVVVLRLVDVEEGGRMGGGRVIYHADVLDGVVGSLPAWGEFPAEGVVGLLRAESPGDGDQGGPHDLAVDGLLRAASTLPPGEVSAEGVDGLLSAESPGDGDQGGPHDLAVDGLLLAASPVPPGDVSAEGVDDGFRGRVAAAGRLVLSPAAKRADWATAEGVRAGLSWAEAEIRRAGLVPKGSAEQVKTWNLSGLFRIRVEGDPEAVWFKATPSFAACEGGAIELLTDAGAEIVPRLIASDPVRRWVLLAHAPGEDCWHAPQEAVDYVVPRMVAAQAELTEKAAGLLDRTPPRLGELTSRLLDGEVGAELDAGELRAARALVAELPGMVDALEACGLPYTLVHGDFHPGNWRWDGRRGVVVDFADCHFGHPALDGLRLRDFAPEDRRAGLAETWVRAWSAAVPGADPGRALTLAEPLAHLYHASRYQEFMDGIEESERRYHAGDSASALRAALASAG